MLFSLPITLAIVIQSAYGIPTHTATTTSSDAAFTPVVDKDGVSLLSEVIRPRFTRTNLNLRRLPDVVGSGLTPTLDETIQNIIRSALEVIEMPSEERREREEREMYFKADHRDTKQ